MNQFNQIPVIEDDPAVALGLQAGLEREGYAVTWKATGKVLGLEMGADDYVTKPYSLRELLRRAYEEFSSAEADLLYAGDLVIDRTRGQVRRGKELVNLTPTEFRLLVFLARHPGQALSRAQIIDAVWGYAADVESERAVNVHPELAAEPRAVRRPGSDSRHMLRQQSERIPWIITFHPTRD